VEFCAGHGGDEVVNSGVLAIVPARGQSRRLPGKNLRPLAGRPLLAWTVDAARAASTIDRVVVSTEDEVVAACALEHGAEVPVLRPSALAHDATPGIDPILHMVEWLGDHQGYRPRLVVVLQPTSPLRTAADIDACIALLDDKAGEAVVSVSPTPFPLSWLRLVDEQQRLVTVPGAMPHDGYVINGAVYLTSRRNLLETRSTYAEPTFAYVMPRERGLDIDTAFDFAIAEWLLSRAVVP
jgi:CMP-N-acetylneuraminic acid synthetase